MKCISWDFIPIIHFLYKGPVSVEYQAIVESELGKCSRCVWGTSNWVGLTPNWVELWLWLWLWLMTWSTRDCVALTPEIKYNMLKKTAWKFEIFAREVWEHPCIQVCNQLVLFEYGVAWLKMEMRENLHAQINEFNKLVCQLLNTGDKIFKEE